MPLSGRPAREKLAELLAVLVVLHQRRARQVRPARSAAGVGAVAEAALADEERRAAVDARLIELRVGCGNRRTHLSAQAGRGQGQNCADRTGEPRTHAGSLHQRLARIRSISSITRFISLTVRSSGSSVVMSTPASFSRSIGYFEPPALRNAR